MKKYGIAIMLVTVFLISAVPVQADMMESVGNGLKKFGTATVDLFKKGKDKVVSLFSSANPDKIPYLVKKANETQYALQAKQQALLELYGISTNGSSVSARPVQDAYLQERANDLQVAWEENQKAVKALKEMMAKCDEKKKDYSGSHNDIRHIEKTQTQLDKNQQTLSVKMAKFLNSSDSSTTGEKTEDNPSGLSKDALAQRFNSADNPYTSAGIGRTTDEEEDSPASPSYEPGLTTEKSSAKSTSIDPNSAQVKALIDQWLNMKGLDPYGRLLGNGITAAGNADTGGMTRETWLMVQFPELRKYVKDNLGTATTGSTTSSDSSSNVVADTATSEARPDSYDSPSAPVSTNTASATEASNASMTELKDSVTSGAGTSDEMKAKYEQYLKADQQRREVLSQQSSSSN